jgi:hypothetical protein
MLKIFLLFRTNMNLLEIFEIWTLDATKPRFEVMSAIKKYNNTNLGFKDSSPRLPIRVITHGS